MLSSKDTDIRKDIGRLPCEEEAEIGVVLPQPGGVWSHHELEEGKKVPSLEALEGAWPC